MNAVVLADGMAKDGREGAREALGRFWKAVSDSARFSPIQRSPDLLPVQRDRNAVELRRQVGGGPEDRASPVQHRDRIPESGAQEVCDAVRVASQKELFHER